MEEAYLRFFPVFITGLLNKDRNIKLKYGGGKLKKAIIVLIIMFVKILATNNL